VPDVVVVSWDSLPIGPDGKLTDDIHAAPDVAIEILSPRQAQTALIRRCRWYVANGVPVALFVDPDDETVFVFRPGAGPVPVRGPASIEIADVPPGFRLTAQELFDSLKLG
jgi:Uma2 family endonuclease